MIKQSIAEDKGLIVNLHFTADQIKILQKSARTHDISVDEFIKRRAISKRLPANHAQIFQAIGNLMLGINRRLENIEAHWRTTPPVSLKQEVTQLSALMKRLERHLKDCRGE